VDEDDARDNRKKGGHFGVSAATFNGLVLLIATRRSTTIQRKHIVAFPTATRVIPTSYNFINTFPVLLVVGITFYFWNTGLCAWQNQTKLCH